MRVFYHVLNGRFRKTPNGAVWTDGPCALLLLVGSFTWRAFEKRLTVIAPCGGGFQRSIEFAGAGRRSELFRSLPYRTILVPRNTCFAPGRFSGRRARCAVAPDDAGDSHRSESDLKLH